jgi:hypothetical protein
MERSILHPRTRLGACAGVNAGHLDQLLDARGLCLASNSPFHERVYGQQEQTLHAYESSLDRLDLETS